MSTNPSTSSWRTLLRSRSLAIWGVLVDVACYKPDLLNGALTPLITGAALVLADELYKVTDHAYNLLFLDEGERRRLQSWHGMDHRKVLLRDLILQKVLVERVVRDELAAALELWGQEPDDEWRLVRAKLDPENYREVELDGGHGWQFDRPDGWLTRPPRSSSNPRGSSSGLMLRIGCAAGSLAGPRRATSRQRSFETRSRRATPYGEPD